MSTQEIANRILALTPAQRRQVLDFVEFIEQKPVRRRQKNSQSLMANANAFATPSSEHQVKGLLDIAGMWAGREEMKDSTAWVRRLRQKEWTSKDGPDAD